MADDKRKPRKAAIVQVPQPAGPILAGAIKRLMRRRRTDRQLIETLLTLAKSHDYVGELFDTIVGEIDRGSEEDRADALLELLAIVPRRPLIPRAVRSITANKAAVSARYKFWFESLDALDEAFKVSPTPVEEPLIEDTCIPTSAEEQATPPDGRSDLWRAVQVRRVAAGLAGEDSLDPDSLALLLHLRFINGGALEPLAQMRRSLAIMQSEALVPVRRVSNSRKANSTPMHRLYVIGTSTILRIVFPDLPQVRILCVLAKMATIFYGGKDQQFSSADVASVLADEEKRGKPE